ncbi:MAG: acyl-CoA thioesterase [Bacteroidales bacterium]
MGKQKIVNQQPPVYEIEMKVRDYELDLQGIVNNANYQHYLEHARHEFLTSKDISFAQLHEEGKDLLISRVEIDYKIPLKSQEKFKVTIRMRKEGHLRLIFNQQILRIPDKHLIVDAKVTGVALNKGKPVKPESILDLERLGIEE